MLIRYNDSFESLHKNRKSFNGIPCRSYSRHFKESVIVNFMNTIAILPCTVALHMPFFKRQF